MTGNYAAHGTPADSGDREMRAWHRVEAVMPAGWRPLVGREEGGWWATASGRNDHSPLVIVSTSENGALLPDIAAALDDLADRLAERRHRP